MLVERYFDMAMRTLSGTRPGPVSLNIPLDIQEAEFEFAPIPERPTFQRHRALDEDGMQTILAALSVAERPVILAGYGVYMSKAWDGLKKFAEEYDIPVATTLRAKGVFPEDHPLSLGVFGYAGTNHSTVALMDVQPKLDTDPKIVPADMILVVGSSLNHRDTMKRSKNLDSSTIFQIDLDPEALGRNFPTKFGGVGDATAAFEYLIAKAPNSLRANKNLRTTWLKEIRKTPKLFKKDYRNWPNIWEGIGLTPEQEGIHPAKAITELHQATLDKCIRDCLVLPDSGAHRAFAAHYWESFEPGTYFTAAGFGPMGWAIPAGIGAKFACPDKTTIVITGDGCMLMHGIEIQTAVQQKLEVIIVVINNAALGNVKLRADADNNKTAQKALSYGDPYEWKKFAEAFGAKGIEINDRKELRKKFHEALDHKGGPVLVDVRCSSHWRTPTRRYRDSESID
jgi:acetolactate synthase-1/2/3 large subunit